MMRRSILRNRTYKVVAVFVAVNILVEAMLPNQLFALTSGPSSPEFSSFEPVATTNMVNDFTGDFTYNLPVLNIPGPDGSGYAMSLSYHSGASPEEEASWVGYGWTLNPGAINRNKRGIPDDWNGMNVDYWNKTKPNKTIAVGAAGGMELYSYSLGVNSSIRYNNYKGFGYVVGVNLGIASGTASLGYNFSDGEGSFSWRINPAKLLKKLKAKNKKAKNKTNEKNKDDTKEGAEASNEDNNKKEEVKLSRAERFGSSVLGQMLGSNTGIFTFSEVSRPTTVTPFIGYKHDIDMSLVANPGPVQIGGSVSLFGSYVKQTNVPKLTPGSYGFLYSQHGVGKMMDFHLEKSSTFNKQDYFIGIPVSDADIYGVTGENLSGGFRAFHAATGHFQPNNVSSTTFNMNAGFSVTVGMSFGGGATNGLGDQTCEVKGQNDHSDSFSGPGSIGVDEPVFFRFNNDMGGYVAYDDHDDLVELAKESWNSPPPSIPQILVTEDDYRSGRASYIGYRFNKDMSRILRHDGEDIRYLAYCKDEDVHKHLDRSETKLRDQIGEFSIVNEDGYRYNYALPVYSKMEKDMSYSISGLVALDSSLHIVHSNASTGNQTVIGEERDDPYATTHLLTSIESPDYIDRLNDGPSDDDFGAYTQFFYGRLHGTHQKSISDSLDYWYKWRMPYTGMYYQKNEMSNQTDDLATLTEGLKEIYYLDSIKTKTHLAIFVKSDRNDGIEASHSNQVDTDSTLVGENQLKKLDRIELYARGDDGNKLLKTIHFEYNYECFPGIPNTIGTEAAGDHGKLSLKAVWFEHEGVYNAKVSPYQFEYTYPTVTYPAKYTGLEMPTGLSETPEYDKLSLDAWGNYQEDGLERFKKMRPWLNQGELDPNFDPAAWQLKNIKLPSGGEIHVQYEQDDYSYVQDKLAHALVRLDPATSMTGNTFILDVETDLGIATGPETVALKNAIVDKINEIYGGYQKRMYFKFLYQLVGDQTPGLNNYLSEYLTGYVYVNNASLVTGDKIAITLGTPNSAQYSEYTLPKNMCEDYVKTQRAGNLSNDGMGGANGHIFQDGDPVDIAERFFNFVETLSNPSDLCLNFNPELSYFKIPMITDKRGGGIRVKRLMMYDEGITSGVKNLYGSEYHYKTYDKELGRWKSSGVATNEPVASREENALVEVLPRGTQSLIGKMVYGRDKKQSEGPLGESFLPSPSVGYSRVVSNNIHTGPTSPGFSVKDFYTVKDYPLLVDYSTLDPDLYYWPLPLGVINIVINNADVEQAFLIKDYNMHGQAKANSTFAGDYFAGTLADPLDLENEDLKNASLVASTRTEYFNPEEGVPVLRDIAELEELNSWDDLPKLPLGKESEIIKEAREVSDHDSGTSGEFDVTVAYTPPCAFVPHFGWSMSGTHMQSDLKTHVVNKVIKYPVVQKRILTQQDNMFRTTEFLAFNPYTGKAILTASNDGFNALDLGEGDHDGDILNLAIPAAYQYEALGPKYQNEALILRSGMPFNPDLSLVEISDQYYLHLSSLLSDDLPRYAKGLFVGDLIEITSTTDTAVCHITEIQGSHYLLAPTYYSTALEDLLGDLKTVQVISSGKSNQLSAKTAEINFYGRLVPELEANTIDSVVNAHTGLEAFVTALNSIGSTADTLAVADYSGLDTLIAGTVPVFYAIDATHSDTIVVHAYTTSPTDSTLICEGLLMDSGNETGTFAIDETTGQIVYYSSQNNLNYQLVPCMNISGFGSNAYLMPRVISASASTYSDDWAYKAELYYPNYATLNFNPYESGTKGRWRTDAAYAYRDSVASVITDTTTNYETGLFGLEVFNWQNLAANNAEKWLKTSSIIQYSPHGQALEEQNLLDIKSTAKFGYHATMPYLIAQNASYSSVLFESFENDYVNGSDTYFEDGMLKTAGVNIDALNAHSGYRSLEIPASGSFTFMNLSSSEAAFLSSKDLMIKFWVKGEYTNHMKARMTHAATVDETIACQKISQVGEWTLYQAILPSISTMVSGEAVQITLKNDASRKVFIDDLKAHPSDAQLNAYVYDVNSLRVICTFDDQHFGLFYQYNAEGKLIRKQKETVRGIKTIQEAQYHTKGVDRPEFDN